MQDTRPLLIDAREAGRLLDMPPARVTRLAKQGSLPRVILPDGQMRFVEDDLRTWIDEHRRPAVAKTEGRTDE